MTIGRLLLWRSMKFSPPTGRKPVCLLSSGQAINVAEMRAFRRANSRCASVFLGIVKRFGGTTPFKPSFGAPADAIRSGGAPDNECTVSFVTATRRLMTSPWEIGNQVLRAFPVRHGAFRATWKCSVCLYAMFNPKPVSASGRHNLAATRLKNAAVPVAITAVLHAVTGLGDAYER